ncbi:MAG TPA: PaaI family thioesterase [Longimicrobium sp.]|nr:PaaI family thioesterase [Longimicrobium sp.]
MPLRAIPYSPFPIPSRSMPFTPQDPGFGPRVRASFAAQPAMAAIGARITRVAPGEVDVELPFRDDLTQQNGFIHAGMLAAVLDSACGYAAFSLMPAGAGVLSIEFKVNLLAPAVGERILVRGRVVRAGRTISVCTADAYAVRDGVERHVSTMTGTMMTMLNRENTAG